MESYRPYTHSDHVEQCTVSSDFVVLGGTSNPELFKTVTKRLGKDAQRCTEYFSNGEVNVKIQDSIRGKHVFLLNSTGFPKPNDYLMEVCLMANAAIKSDAAEVTAVIPKIGYDRQDRMNRNRTPISIGVVLDFLEKAGISRLISVDIHSEQSGIGSVARKDLLYGSYILAAALKNSMPDKPMIVAPDAGASARAAAFRGILGIKEPVPQISKVRDDETGKTDIVGISLDVSGYDVILPDDVISSGGTTAKCAQFLKERGARTVTAVSTHGEFTGRGLKYFDEDWVDRVLVTDSIRPRPDVLRHNKVEVYSIAPLISEAIYRTFYKKSISELFRNVAPEEDVILLNRNT